MSQPVRGLGNRKSTLPPYPKLKEEFKLKWQQTELKTKPNQRTYCLYCLTDFAGLKLVAWASIWRITTCIIATVGDFLLSCSILLFCFTSVSGNLSNYFEDKQYAKITITAKLLSSCLKNLHSYCCHLVCLLIDFCFFLFSLKINQ